VPWCRDGRKRPEPSAQDDACTDAGPCARARADVLRRIKAACGAGVANVNALASCRVRERTWNIRSETPERDNRGGRNFPRAEILTDFEARPARETRTAQSAAVAGEIVRIPPTITKAFNRAFRKKAPNRAPPQNTRRWRTGPRPRASAHAAWTAPRAYCGAA
jgi:hypothetical protein